MIPKKHKLEILQIIDQSNGKRINYNDLSFLEDDFSKDHYDFIMNQFNVKNDMKNKKEFIDSLIYRSIVGLNLKLSKVVIGEFDNLSLKDQIHILNDCSKGYFGHPDNKILIGKFIEKMMINMIQSGSYININHHMLGLEKNDPAYSSIIQGEIFFLNNEYFNAETDRNVYNNVFCHILSLKKCVIGSDEIDINQLMNIHYALIKLLKKIENHMSPHTNHYEMEMMRTQAKDVLILIAKHSNYSDAKLILKAIE